MRREAGLNLAQMHQFAKGNTDASLGTTNQKKSKRYKQQINKKGQSEKAEI